MDQRSATGAARRELVAPSALEESGRQVRGHALDLDSEVLAPLEQTEALHGPGWTGLAREQYLGLHQGIVQTLQQAQVRVDGLGAAMGRSAVSYARLSHIRFGPGGPTGGTGAAALPTETEYVAGGGGGDRSALTNYGQGLIDKMRGMGVNIRQDEEAENFLRWTNARGGTKFWGNIPGETDVFLRSDAVDATVYEEYLHVQRGAARGWVSNPDNIAVWMEEVEVEQEVLSHADTLGMTPTEIKELEDIRANYLRLLREQAGLSPQ